LAALLGEHPEDHRLLLGELLRLAVPGAGAERAEVDFVVAEAQHRGGGGGGGAAVPVPAPQDRAHAQQELLQMKGLGEVVIAAGLQAPDAIHGIAACGEKQHRRVVALLAQRAAHAEAVDPRQHHIEHDERAAALAQPLERLLAIARGAHLVAFGAQVLHDAGGEVRIVLHHQHARARGGAHERCPCAAGQVSTKCAPWPTPSLCALTRPCPRCIRRCTMKSPRPVPYWLPGPRGCRRVNLSNRRAPSAGRKPTPLSRTDSSTSPLSARALRATLPPPSGVTAASAFSRMLRTTTSSASGSLPAPPAPPPQRPARARPPRCRPRAPAERTRPPRRTGCSGGAPRCAAPPRPAARAPRARRRPRSAAAAAARAARSLRHRAVPARPPPARHTRRAPRALSAPPARADRGSTSRPARPTPPPAAAQ